jgi:hypothetical protein
VIEIPVIPDLRRNPPASEVAIADLELRLGHSLPPQYKLFLSQADGFSIGGGLLIYSTSEIAERNSTWGVPEHLPSFLAIGDTGGSELILVDHNDSSTRLYIVGPGALFPDMMRELAPSLETWLKKGCELPED